MKCGLCRAPMMGHGHMGTPLFDGIVCGNCNLAVMYVRVPCPNQPTKIQILEWCRAGTFLEELRKHEQFSVGQ